MTTEKPLRWGHWIRRSIHWTARLIAVCSLAFYLSAKAESVEELFRQGNELYSSGKYEEAIKRYTRITDAGFENEWVHYNLGNAYFKSDQIGLAVLQYEKALKLAPYQAEIVDNLELARARIIDKVEPMPATLVERLWSRLSQWPSLDAQTAVVLVLFLAANGAFSVFILVRPPRWRIVALAGAGSLLFLSLCSGIVTGIRIYQESTVRSGVVLAEQTNVLSGPGSDNPVLFSIHEGLKVAVGSEVNGWVQISLDNGWNGWVRQEVLGMI
ncbi:MAG: tetratricopeptide repeat protein [Acidobacteriota bacterium]